MKTAQEVWDSTGDKTEQEVVAALLQWGEEIREEAANKIRSFKVPLEDAEPIVKAIMEPQNGFIEIIAGEVGSIQIK